MDRSSGILMSISSLPANYGIGTLGKEAEAFVDWLSEAGQTYWQILPVGPTGFGDSPYQSFSAFAGNPLLISPEKLMEDGLLEMKDLQMAYVKPEARVDYNKAKEAKLPLLEKAYQAFKAAEKPDDYAGFCEKNAFWLDDYALYMALKDHFRAERANETSTENFDTFAAECEGLKLAEKQMKDYYIGANWVSFPKTTKKRNAMVLKKWRKTLADAIEKEIFLQYIFQKQWQAVKAYANENGVKVSILTDCPVLPQDSLAMCAGLAVKSGMDPFDALRAITINAAEHAQVGDRVGSLEAGKDADIIIADESINIIRTIKKGRTIYEA